MKHKGNTPCWDRQSCYSGQIHNEAAQTLGRVDKSSAGEIVKCPASRILSSLCISHTELSLYLAYQYLLPATQSSFHVLQMAAPTKRKAEDTDNGNEGAP